MSVPPEREAPAREARPKRSPGWRASPLVIGILLVALVVVLLLLFVV
jgi:hypothetical protein